MKSLNFDKKPTLTVMRRATVNRSSVYNKTETVKAGFHIGWEGKAPKFNLPKIENSLVGKKSKKCKFVEEVINEHR